jgi:acylphosphatase
MTPEAGSQAIRTRVIYSGHVQGVCFRAISRELSRRFRVVGYVRNQPDGTVELEAEGTPSEVEGFLSAIGQEFSGYIAHAERASRPSRGDENRFEIRY